MSLYQADAGIVMIVFLPSFLDPAVRAHGPDRTAEKARLDAQYPGNPNGASAALKAWDAAHPEPKTRIAKVADHIDHIRAAIGVDQIGLGGDYDGMDSAPVGQEDVAGHPALFAELAGRGDSQSDVQKVARGKKMR